MGVEVFLIEMCSCSFCLSIVHTLIFFSLASIFPQVGQCNGPRFAYFIPGFHPFFVQDCVAIRTSLEGKLARLLVRNHELEDELASWRLHGEPDPSLLATLGASDVLLSLLLAGGVAWRQYYGPDGPVYPIDR